MKIIIKESVIVRPSQPTPQRRLWLSNLDLLHGRIHLPTVYLYNPDGSPNFFDTMILIEALSEALVSFYPAAGRLERNQSGRVEINCNGEGVLFVKAETDCSMSDLGDFAPSSELLQLVPKVDYSRDVSSYPLVILQVTKFSCGGVCLGVGFHHSLADGEGALHFINSWSNLAHGIPISPPPLLDRSILRARFPPSPKFHHVEYDPPPIPKTFPESKQVSSQKNSMAILKLPLDQIYALKDKVNTKESKFKYSTYEILTAHIWRCVSQSRSLPDDQETKLHMSVDGRSRLRPSVPPGYFGNVIFHTTPIALSGELTSEPLAKTVERIHKAIGKMNDEYCRSAIDYLEDPDDPNAVMQVPGTCKFPNLKIISWIRLPFSCADFGWGRPAFLRPGNLFEGKANILPSFGDDGNLSLAICLQEDHMKAFKKLLYLLD